MSIFWLIALLTASGAHATSSTKEVWNAAKGNFLTGRLVYRDIRWTTGPGGEKEALDTTWDLLKNSGRDYRDTVLKAPDTAKDIYKSAVIQSYTDYTDMASDNWSSSKKSLADFRAVRQSYVEEGNWGLMQCTYYTVKGSSRVLWALGILNSSEALYSIGKTTVKNAYYVTRYPVGGTLKLALAPVAFVGGTVWAVTTTAVTAGWALPFAVIVDAGKLVTGKL